MSFDSTITEYDVDANAKQIAQGLRGEGIDLEPDLDVDGLEHSILSRLFGLFGVGKS